MAERVVDALEVVEVDEQQRQRLARDPRQLDLLAQALHEGHPVGQAGQRIVVREVVDARLRGVAVAQVAHHRHAQLLVAIDQRAADELHRDAHAVLADDGAFVAELLAAVEHRLHARALVRRDEVQRMAAAQLGERVAQELAQRRVGVGDDAAAVERDAFGARLHELGQAFLGLAQRLRGQPMLRDVGDDHEGAHRAAGGAQVRQHVDFDPAPASVGGREFADVGHRAALVDHSIDRGLYLAGGGLADDLHEGLADDRGFGEPEGARVGLVGEAAAVTQLGRVVIGDHRRHAVGEQPEYVETAVPGSHRSVMDHAR